VKVDGLLLTYQRGHKAVMNTHAVGGNTENTRFVGMDQYGNKYYEEFELLRKYIVSLDRNQRRWV
jgi:NADH:ubiquinone oxidoreductase subunit